MEAVPQDASYDNSAQYNSGALMSSFEQQLCNNTHSPRHSSSLSAQSVRDMQRELRELREARMQSLQAGARNFNQPLADSKAAVKALLGTMQQHREQSALAA